MGRNARAHERFIERPAELRDVGFKQSVRVFIFASGESARRNEKYFGRKNFHGKLARIFGIVFILGIFLLRTGQTDFAGGVHTKLSVAADDSFIFVPNTRRTLDAAKTFSGRYVICRRRLSNVRRY